jgi:DNA repair exonuclease SbcCD ATPase subunit
VTAAKVTWRPLGALLVEKGLLTAEELEDALAAQQTTGKRLGQILVDRGHVSGPALTNALAEQYGIELKTEEGFGTGLRAEIERRHSTRRPPVEAGETVAELPLEAIEAVEALAEPEDDGEDGHVDVALAELEPQLEEHWARLAAAEENVAAREARIAELEAELVAAQREADLLARRLEELASEGDETPAPQLLATELADRERELTELEQVLAGRQQAILTAAADLEQRRQALEERERALDGREVATAPAAAPDETAPAPGGPWSLDTLTRLVEERADDFPDRVDDWRYTLFYLRNEAHVDGTLPARFDSLVEECFGDLLGSAIPALAR